jgi:hypothetical protein
MKKNIRNIVKIMPVFVLMIFLAACARGDEYKSSDTIKILEGGTYYYEGTFYDGSDLDGYTIEMAVKESEFVIAFSDKKGSELGRSVNVDGKGYYVDASAKEYSRDTYYDDVTFDYSGLEFLESGNAKIVALKGIEDESLFFEKFEATYGTETETMQFFFKEDKLYAIQEDFIDATGTKISEVVIINKISSEIPQDWFGIPEDYTETK